MASGAICSRGARPRTNLLDHSISYEGMSERKGEDVFLLEGPDNTYRITPFDPGFEKKMEKAEEIMARYRNTLHTLAK